jgi:hypothetical protein
MRVVFIEERAKRELLKEFLEKDSLPFSAWTRYSLLTTRSFRMPSAEGLPDRLRELLDRSMGMSGLAHGLDEAQGQRQVLRTSLQRLDGLLRGLHARG